FGPTGVRPRVGFKPIKPLKEAGIRIDPPPSLAVTMGTIPAFKAAAAPPLDPPAFKSGFNGKLTGPVNSASDVFLNPNSGVLVRPTTTNPASRTCWTKWSVD